MFNDTSPGRRWYAMMIAAMLLMAGYLFVWHSPELAAVQRWATEASQHPAVIVAVILIMAVTLTIGLSSSIGLWLIAPFYTPLAATPMLTLGSVVGSLGAYYLSSRLGERWASRGFAGRIMGKFEARGDFLTQCALRMLPGFPHTVINVAAGLLRLPLVTFVMAATLGLGVKWAVYSSAIYGALEAVENEEAISFSVLLPLIALTLMLLVGAWLRRRFEARSAPRN